MRLFWKTGLVGAMSAFAAIAACSSSNTSSGTTTASGGAGTLASGTGLDGTFAMGSGAGIPAGSGGADTCAGNKTIAKPVQVDIYMMLDHSGSMKDDAGGKSKWQRVQDAITQFVQQPSAAGIGVGIQYFGLHPSKCKANPACTVDGDCGDPSCGPCIGGNTGSGFCNGAAGDSCDPTDYSKADVGIQSLPGVSGAIVASLMANPPGFGATPTSAALTGAIEYAKAWEKQNPTHQTVIVFATDGLPTECDTNINDLDSDAKVSLQHNIPVYVIGVGPNLQTLDGIAAAGGTMMAVHVDQNPNATQQFLDALNGIRTAHLSCTYEIPPPDMGKQADFTKINVVYKPGGGGSPEILIHVDSLAQCMAGMDEWYYDDPANPKSILLCPETCSKLSKDMSGEVDIEVGCQTKVPA